MIEVELKVPVNDREQLNDKLLKLGFVKGDRVKETDTYFDNQVNQIKNSDSALRVRSRENFTWNLSEHFMAYKGPKMDDVSMTRKEVEMQIADASVGKEILAALGYVKMYPVVKIRQYYSHNQVTACLDQVECLGDFLELEIVVSQEDEKQEALDTLVSLLQEIGYSSKETIRTSYLSMLQGGAFNEGKTHRAYHDV